MHCHKGGFCAVCISWGSAEFDIGVPDIPLCIEYSSIRWHYGKQDMDDYKKELCKRSNVRLIQIIEDCYRTLEHCIEDDYICFKMEYSKQGEILIHIVTHILKSIGHSISEIDLELFKKNAWDYSKGKIEVEKSLAGAYPELAKEWNATLNDKINPEGILCGSNRIIYWQCSKCEHGANGEWYAMTYNRMTRKTGCAKCGYNWYKAQQGLPQRYRGLYSYLNNQDTAYADNSSGTGDSGGWTVQTGEKSIWKNNTGVRLYLADASGGPSNLKLVPFTFNGSSYSMLDIWDPAYQTISCGGHMSLYYGVRVGSSSKHLTALTITYNTLINAGLTSPDYVSDSPWNVNGSAFHSWMTSKPQVKKIQT